MTTPIRLARAGMAAGIFLLAALLVYGFQISGPRIAASSVASIPVTVEPSRHPRIVGPLAIGINNAVWDRHLLGGSAPLILRSGARLLRYPGGSTADVFHWTTNAITPGHEGWAEPGNTFDAWMQEVVQPSHSQAMLTVNYGSNADGTQGGDPQEAAAWVNYANNVRGYGVTYWEIGNEVYANGYYGSPWDWETDVHIDKSPAAYASNVKVFAAAMRAVDPSIKLGIDLTVPGASPDGRGPEPWNSTVLAAACDAIDFVSLHWYPQDAGAESDGGLLASTDAIENKVRKTRQLLDRYCGPHARDVQIMVTETDSVSRNPGKQTTSGVNALFLAEDYLSWLQAGAANVDWWDLRNGPNSRGNMSVKLLGSRAIGDFGLLSSGGEGEPQANVGFPSYRALRLISTALVPNAAFASVHVPRSPVRVFALVHRRTLRLAIVNTSRRKHYRLSVTTRDLPKLGSGMMSQLDGVTLRVHSQPLRVTPTGLTYTARPYTLAMLTLRLD